MYVMLTMNDKGMCW